MTGMIAFGSSSSFAGELFKQVISYKEQYGAFRDLRVRFEPTARTKRNPFCGLGSDIPAKQHQSGTSGYYSLSFKSPSNWFCKYKPLALMGNFTCGKSVGCAKDTYPVAIYFSHPGGVDYDSLNNDSTGYEKVIPFSISDPYSIVQLYLANPLVNERDAFQFVVVPR